MMGKDLYSIYLKLEKSPKEHTCLQTELIEVMATTAIALTQVVAATIWGSIFLKLKASALARFRSIDPGGV